MGSVVINKYGRILTIIFSLDDRTDEGSVQETNVSYFCQKYMRFYANVRKRGILVPKTPRPEVTDNAPPLTSLYHALDPKHSFETGFQCISQGAT